MIYANKSIIWKLGTALALAGALIFGAHKYLTTDSRYKAREIAAVASGVKRPFEERLRSADDIEVKEAYLSYGKHYDVYVDNSQVAEVTGKGFKIL
jgi:hypothetical protein